MYEDQTYETILKRTLGRVSDSIDKREGSVIWDVCAPAAAELAQTYINMEWSLKEAFVSTATRPWLLTAGKEEGIPLHEATAAEVKGVFNLNIPLGSRFSLEEVNYEVVDKLEDCVFLLRCETAGSTGNRTGTLVPIQYIDGLASAEATEIVTNGEDEEETEHYRQRLLSARKKPITSGNKYHYEQWAVEVTGVGAARCQPLWNGPGTVRVLITDMNMRPAGETLIQDTAEHIEAVRPVGAQVTVAAPEEKPVTVSVKVTLSGGTYLEAVKQDAMEKIGEYIRGLAFAGNFVSLALIGSLLLDIPGVIDYENLELNGSVANVRIEENQVPVLGSVEVSV